VKRLFFIIVTICIIFQPGFSQKRESPEIRILFHGLVMDASDLSPVANSQILINRSYSTISSTDGTFAFYVNISDTVVFTSFGYKPTVMHVSDTLTGAEFVAGIYLNSDTISIGEVIIVPRFSNIKSEILNAPSKTPAVMENARYNVAISAYQGRTNQSNLGDPAINYGILRHQQRIEAYERGGIPSDKIVGLSPFMLLPLANLLLNGLPEKPAPLKSQVTNQEMDQIHKKYLETLRQRR